MTKSKFIVDANVFLRFLLNDIEDQYLEAEKLFKKAKTGKAEIIVPQIIIFEIAFSLGKYYSFSKEVVVDKINSILSTPYFNIQNKNLLALSLSRYQKCNLSLTDCFLLDMAENEKGKVFSFDKSLNKTVNRRIK